MLTSLSVTRLRPVTMLVQQQVRWRTVIPFKKQVTVTSIWKADVYAPPESVDPGKFMSASATHMYDIPYVQKRGSGAIERQTAPDSQSVVNKGTRLLKCILSMRRTVKVNEGGKVVSMSAMVVVGNGKGAAGFGEGKDIEVAGAVKKATEKAIKNMVYVDRYDDRTILHDIKHTFKATNVQLRAASAGFGIRANANIHEICRCAGIHDLGAKVHGSRNSINVIKATFEAFEKQKTPETLARERGLKLVDVRKLMYGQ